MLQAVTLAAEQYANAELAKTLDGIREKVNELEELRSDDRIGTLNHLSGLAAGVELAAERDGRISDLRLEEMRTARSRAEEVWQQSFATAQRRLDEYRDGTLEPAEVETSVIMLMYSTSVLAQCSEALAAVPYATNEELAEALAENRDRLSPAVADFRELCRGVLAASGEWEAHQIEYESYRAKNPIVRRLRLPPVQVRNDEHGFGLTVPRKPKRGPIRTAETERVQAVLAASEKMATTLLAEVTEDGAILIGPGPGPATDRPAPG